MTKLSDEERDALDVPYDWRWPADSQVVYRALSRRTDGASVAIFRSALSAHLPDGGPYSPPVDVALAVITAAGLNPWYREAKELRERVAKLEKQLEDYPYGRCACGDRRQAGWCSGGCDNDE